MKSSFLIFYFLLLATPSLFAKDCSEWFKDSKIKKDNSCLIKCVSFTVDMGTFECPNQCDELCETSETEKFLFKISDLYPGLTTEERVLATKNPTKVLKAYQLSWDAEKECLNLFSSSRASDESDACRHFVWAALLYKEFGVDFSSQILNAHEQDPKQPQQEKSMDLANNRLGQLSAEQLIKDKKFNSQSVIKSFEDNLKHGRLIVLKKRGIK